eukprot:353438-Chlamydomonas_euryale.AAC.17
MPIDSVRSRYFTLLARYTTGVPTASDSTPLCSRPLRATLARRYNARIDDQSSYCVRHTHTHTQAHTGTRQKPNTVQKLTSKAQHTWASGTTP